MCVELLGEGVAVVFATRGLEICLPACIEEGIGIVYTKCFEAAYGFVAGEPNEYPHRGRIEGLLSYVV